MHSDYTQRESETLENKKVLVTIKRNIVVNRTNSYKLQKEGNEKLSKIVGGRRKKNTGMIRHADKNFLNARVELGNLHEILKHMEKMNSTKKVVA